MKCGNTYILLPISRLCNDATQYRDCEMLVHNLETAHECLKVLGFRVVLEVICLQVAV